MLKNLIRPGMILIPFLLGVLFPQASAFRFLIRYLLMGMLFLTCLQLHLRELKLQKWHLFLLLENIALALVLYLLFHFLGREDLALAAFFTGITPTANAAPVVIGFLHGRVPFAVTAFAVTNLGVSAALVVLLPWITGNSDPFFMLRIAGSLLEVIGIPLLLAQLVRRIFPKASEWPKKCSMLSFSLWSATLFIMAGVASGFLRENPEGGWTLLQTALLTIGICVLNFYLGGRLAPRRIRKEMSQLLGQKNTSFTTFAALTFASAQPMAAMGPVFYVFWHNIWNAVQMFRYDRRRSRKREKQTRLTA